MTPTPDPSDTARAFLHAIVWGEHTLVWDLLSDQGRATAISVALSNGLDRVVAGRIRDDLADPAEKAEFLRQLVLGLRRDLRSVELDDLALSDRTEHLADGSASIELLSPSTLPGTGPWSAGSLVLSRDGSAGWRVDRLEPRLTGP